MKFDVLAAKHGIALPNHNPINEMTLLYNFLTPTMRNMVPYNRDLGLSCGTEILHALACRCSDAFCSLRQKTV